MRAPCVEVAVAKEALQEGELAAARRVEAVGGVELVQAVVCAQLRVGDAEAPRRRRVVARRQRVGQARHFRTVAEAHVARDLALPHRGPGACGSIVDLELVEQAGVAPTLELDGLEVNASTFGPP